MYEIVHTTPATDWFALFISLEEGTVYPVPVMLWATIKKDNIQKIVGVVDPPDYEENLMLLNEYNAENFWRYVQGDKPMPSKEEIDIEVDFQRKWQIDELTDEFLHLAIQQGVISKDFSDEIVSAIKYPFMRGDKPIYGASTISFFLEFNGIPDWQDRPEENEKIKKLYAHWSHWHRARFEETDYLFVKEEKGESDVPYRMDRVS